MDCKFIRINPDSEKFDGNAMIGTIVDHINEANKKLIEESTKKSLIDELSIKLLGLEFKSNHSIKSKCMKYIVKKYGLHYKNEGMQKSECLSDKSNKKVTISIIKHAELLFSVQKKY